jgi:predicted GIY-YIG superfamily endonuclease
MASLRERAQSERRLYHLYVVGLDRALCVRRGCLARNGRAPVYVGQSAHSPEARFKQHKAEYKSSRFVREFGVQLLPRLYQRSGAFLSRSEAIDGEQRLGEQRLARQLESSGYCVFGGH